MEVVVESKNYEVEELHQHPLLLVSNQQDLWEIRKGGSRCSRCSDLVFSPYFSCETEGCNFYLHKVCAYPALELNHPFHPNHPLLLLSKLPDERRCFICGLACGIGYAYECSSCGLTFHITCAIFTFNIAAQNYNFKDFDEHLVLEAPSRLEYAKSCILCWEPLESYSYFSGSFHGVHKRCCEIPHKLNHACHRKHPLLLQFKSRNLSNCKICQKTKPGWFIYACSPCDFAIHTGCVSPSPTIEHETHPHPFNLLLRQGSFICDACGTQGAHLAYTCGSCNILVHKECTSLPRFIKSKWHDHRVSHTYSLHREHFTTLDCIICHDEVDTDYGNYCCKYCNVIFHTKCALKDEESYEIVSDDEESLDESIKSFTVLERNDAGEATVIEHCKHIIGHHLMLSDDRAREYDDKCCDGCLLPMSASFYHCSVSKCDFFLHKVCAEFPKEKQVCYHHGCRQPLLLTSNEFFYCKKCGCFTNAFGYKCNGCSLYACLRCVIALTPGAQRHPGHEHHLFYYHEKVGRCNACGEDDIQGLFRCKKCEFRLDHKCFSLPITAWHKCDEHRLSLTYHDDNSYLESHFCDTCEERRNPNPWFYHCATCDTSVHVKCIQNFHSSKSGVL